jgi:hypothetical protein
VTELVWTLVHEGILPALGAAGVEKSDREEICGEGGADGTNSNGKINEILAMRRFLVKCGRACRRQPALAKALLPLVFLCLLRIEFDRSLTHAGSTEEGGGGGGGGSGGGDQCAGHEGGRTALCIYAAGG